jgi:hypothetical protein
VNWGMLRMGLKTWVLLFGLFWIICPAHADKRVAVVIGNSAYQSVAPLDNPKNDAALMAKTLQALGFTLVGAGAQLDLNKADTDRTVLKFGDLAQGADVGLFYYAGHGLQVHGENFLVPVDANPMRETDVDFQMLDTNLVLRQMAGAGTKLNVLILDACRNNPFGGRGLRDAGGGLAQMRAPEGTLIAFATQPGNVAQDGSDGHSPYTEALADTIRKPGLDIFRIFNEVGLTVMKATGKAQQPWLSTSPINGEFYFLDAPNLAAPTAPGEPSVQALQAANELFAIMSTDMVNQLIEQTTNAVWPMIDQAARGDNVDDATIAELRKEFQRIELDFVTDQMKGAPAIYARHFNAAELHDLAAFYRTSTGAVVLHELPRVTGDLAASMFPRMQGLQEQMVDAFRSVLREHGYDK